MSKIIPISITTTEQAVILGATYQFVWLRNMGENDVLLSDHSGIVAGDDDVMTVKAGESGRISTSGRAVYIKAVSGTSTGEIHAQNFSDAPFKSRGERGGQIITVEPLSVTENGVYTAPTGKAYSPVTVDVQEEPWTPLQDGYSNFWFELTNDTLSPWLNFSAKNANATIDWGDGSGEVALDTLTPTHTYSKAGKYVVKVKGVTGIGRQVTPADVVQYPLVYVELSEDITNISSNTFYECINLKEASIYTASLPNGIFLYCYSLQRVHMHSNPATISGQAFQDCRVLRSFDLTGVTTLADNVFYACRYFTSITLPATIDTMGNNIFNGCLRLSEIHIQATTPPTLGNTAFSGLPSDYIIYVPVGYGDTYKAASGWSNYADHVLEEGETPTRAMVAKFNAMKTDEPQDEMR